MKKIILLLFLFGISLENFAQISALFIPKSRWILLDNKIEGDEILLTPYDSTKFEINTLILTFGKNNKIEYDYESHAEVCYGVDFLDMDSDETSWEFDKKTNLLTLTVKGGYSSIEDFKFKRDYEIWTIVDGNFRLQQVKEYYFEDLQDGKRVKKHRGNRRR